MYKFKMFAIFIVLICIFGKTNAYIRETPLIGKIIFLDPGHGGKDPGAYYKDIYEDDINLKISLKLKNLLEKMGAIVYITRDADYDLSVPGAYLRKKSDLTNRTKMINSSDAQIYLSIHLNSSTNTSWNGAQAFYDDINSENQKIAKTFQKYFNSELNSSRKEKEISNLYMYKNINIPGVLLELGFISNSDERYLLTQEVYQEKLIKTLTNAIIEILC